MSPVGLANTRISTDYAQKSPRSLLHTLHEGHGGRYEVPPLTAPKTVTPWAQTLLHRRVWFKVVECWQLGGVYRCCFWMGC